MPRASSRDLRERLIWARKADLSANEVERTLDASSFAVGRHLPW